MENKNYMAMIISILIVPLELFFSNIASIYLDSKLNLLATILIVYSGFLIVIFLNKKLLKVDFEKFKINKIKNILVALCLVVAMHILLYLIRIPLKNLSISGEVDVLNLPLYQSIPLMLIPLTAPFVEEIVFRHHLFYRFKNKGVKSVMFFISSILFGLIHYNNFNGDLIQLIPYIFMGAFFNVIYLYYKNIWNSITVHFIFNLINVSMGVVGLILIRFM